MWGAIIGAVAAIWGGSKQNSAEKKAKGEQEQAQRVQQQNDRDAAAAAGRSAIFPNTPEMAEYDEFITNNATTATPAAITAKANELSDRQAKVSAGLTAQAYKVANAADGSASVAQINANMAQQQASQKTLQYAVIGGSVAVAAIAIFVLNKKRRK